MIEADWKGGGCFCGAVRYRVRGEAVWKAGCTCNTCVKMHAAPYVVWAGFDRSDYELTTGKPVIFRSSPHVVREFCATCGSSLTYGKDATGAAELEHAARLVYVAVTTLDDPAAYPPDEVVHGQERIGWLHLDDSIPMRNFVSPEAGHLQFGGIDQSRATELAKKYFDPDKDPDE
jgi:hypothetical protein